MVKLVYIFATLWKKTIKCFLSDLPYNREFYFLPFCQKIEANYVEIWKSIWKLNLFNLTSLVLISS